MSDFDKRIHLESGMTKIKIWMGVDKLLLLALMVVMAIHAMHPITDPDTPWQFATGNYILHTHSIPTSDPFSWTAKGNPWVTQEWLYDVALAWVVSHFQDAGAWLFLVLVQLITALLVYRIAVSVSNGNRIVSAAVTLVGMSILLPFWIFRPQVVSYCMFVVFLWILNGVRTGNDKRLWLVPPCMLLWANTHASAVLGILMLLFEIVLSFVFRSPRLPKGAILSLVLASLAGMLIGLVNPNGIHVYTYALLANDKAMTNAISEWQSPNFHNDYFEYIVLPYIVLLLGVLLLRKGDKRQHAHEIVYFLGFLALTLISQRYLPYLGLVSMPLWAYLFANWGQSISNPNRFVVFSNAVLMALSFVYLAVNLPHVRGSFQSHWSKTSYPISAVNYLKHHPQLLKLRLLDAYEWGGYLIYRHIPTFIDGRTGIYLRGPLFSDYLQMQNMGKRGPQLLNKYRIQMVLFPPGRALTTFLEHSNGWRVIYHNNASVIFERAGMGVS